MRCYSGAIYIEYNAAAAGANEKKMRFVPSLIIPIKIKHILLGCKVLHIITKG